MSAECEHSSIHLITIYGNPCNGNPSPCNGDQLPCNGNPLPFNGNTLPFMETIFVKNKELSFMETIFKNKACLREKTLFLMLNLLKNIKKNLWVSTAYNCSLHM